MGTHTANGKKREVFCLRERREHPISGRFSCVGSTRSVSSVPGGGRRHYNKYYVCNIKKKKYTGRTCVYSIVVTSAKLDSTDDTFSITLSRGSRSKRCETNRFSPSQTTTTTKTAPNKLKCTHTLHSHE